MRNLRFGKIWLMIGWLLTLFIIISSLIPIPPDTLATSIGDKTLHLLVYLCLMLWFGFIYLPGKDYLKIGVGLVLMGMALEFLQGAMSYHRSMEFFDALFNTIGVTTGWFLSKTPISSLLLRLESLLFPKDSKDS